MLLNIKNWKGQTVYIIIVRLILANILKSVVLLLCSMPPRYPLAFFLFCNYFRHIPTSNLCTCLSFGQYAFLVNVQVGWRLFIIQFSAPLSPFQSPLLTTLSKVSAPVTFCHRTVFISFRALTDLRSYLS